MEVERVAWPLQGLEVLDTLNLSSDASTSLA